MRHIKFEQVKVWSTGFSLMRCRLKPVLQTYLLYSYSKFRFLYLLLVLSLLCLPVFEGQARADVSVPSVIGDNMIVQQGQRVRVWGKAEPSERVTVRLGKQIARTKANAQGRWQAFVGPFASGGPHILTVTGNNTLTFNNVLVGEVWVCSGQSNMEWTLANAAGGPEAATQANYNEMRLFTVQKKTSDTPLDDVQGRWVITTPQTAAQFSAVGFYFGREVYQQLKVPVGLIHTSWGGTPAEAWTSRNTLASVSSLKTILDRYENDLRNLPQLQSEFEKLLVGWNRLNLQQDPGNKGEALGYASSELDLADWKKMNLPQLWEAAGLNIDGAVWFRKEIDVPQSWTGQDLILNLGAIDDADTSYFNGVRVGSTGTDVPNSYLVQRRYKVSGSLVRAGSKNTIAVRVFDWSGGGGIGATSGEMSLSREGQNNDAISLEGVWNYKTELALAPKTPDWSSRPSAPPGPNNPNSPSVLYNAMIAPLTPYAIRGAIWYQGESNAGRAFQYRTLFPAMIRDWRAAWGKGNFPFYFVQLANYLPVKPEPGESEWAELREAQAMTLREPQTGMAVAIDIGVADDVHPRNKQTVGTRLSRWALAETYRKRMTPSGPLYNSFLVEGDKIRVHFKYANGGLHTSDGRALKGFAIAGPDRKFVWAEARIEGDSVIVWSKEVPEPSAVRYAWADNPLCNLYNGVGLPASPFRTDDWTGLTVGRN